MELYEKKFPIYEKCMTSIFGQPGKTTIFSTEETKINKNKQQFLCFFRVYCNKASFPG